MKLAKALSQRIKALREAAGLSQQEVAVRGDLSLSLVAKLEQAKKADPRASTLLALAGALGVRPGQLLDDLFPAPPPPCDQDEQQQPQPQPPAEQDGALAGLLHSGDGVAETAAAAAVASNGKEPAAAAAAKKGNKKKKKEGKKKKKE